MPTVWFDGTEIECEEGAVLREVLREAGTSPHNGLSKYLNCRGHGACGTCAVEVAGNVSEPTSAERNRLSKPPLGDTENLRLACQTRVQGDVTVFKHDGFWGQHEDE